MSVNLDINRTIMLARAELMAARKIRMDAESSMLDANEYAAAIRVYQILEKKYGNEIENINEIYKQIEEYIRSSKDKLQKQKRKKPAIREKDDPFLIDPLAMCDTALRAIKMPAPAGSRWQNNFHPGATSTYLVGDKNVSFRRLGALFWLAASDPNMSIDPADLETAQTRGAEAEKRHELIESAKFNFISILAEMRRAHNGDPGYPPKSSSIDGLTCEPGAFGRITSSVMYNQLVVVHRDPLLQFKDKCGIFIKNKLEKLSREEQKKLYDIFESRFVMFETLNSAQQKLYSDFISGLKKELPNFMESLNKDYGDAIISKIGDRSAQIRAKAAEAIFNSFVYNIDISNNDARPPEELSILLRDSNEKNVIFLTVKDKIQTNHKAFFEQYDKLYKEMQNLEKLTKELESGSVSTLERISKTKALMDRAIEISRNKQKIDNEFRIAIQDESRKALNDNGIKIFEEAFTNFKVDAFLPDLHVYRNNYDKLRQQIENNQATLLEKYQSLRKKELETAINDFFTKKLTGVNFLSDLKTTGAYGLDRFKTLNELKYDRRLIWDSLEKDYQTLSKISDEAIKQITSNDDLESLDIAKMVTERMEKEKDKINQIDNDVLKRFQFSTLSKLELFAAEKDYDDLKDVLNDRTKTWSVELLNKSLCYAASRGEIGMMKLLISKGADPKYEISTHDIMQFNNDSYIFNSRMQINHVLSGDNASPAKLALITGKANVIKEMIKNNWVTPEKLIEHIHSKRSKRTNRHPR